MRHTTRIFLTAAALGTSLAAGATAQGTRMNIRPESKVTLAGSSNVHDWACRGTTFQATIELDSTYATTPLTRLARPITRVSVVIPVQSLTCGKSKMDDNMYKALRASEFPEIRYVLTDYTIDASRTTADSFVANTKGELSIAGRTVTVEIPITAERKDNGTMVGTGTLPMRMTDVGVKPPVALLGTLRTKNEIAVSFTVLLDRASVVALMGN